MHNKEKFKKAVKNIERVVSTEKKLQTIQTLKHPIFYIVHVFLFLGSGSVMREDKVLTFTRCIFSHDYLCNRGDQS